MADVLVEDKSAIYSELKSSMRTENNVLLKRFQITPLTGGTDTNRPHEDCHTELIDIAVTFCTDEYYKFVLKRKRLGFECSNFFPVYSTQRGESKAH